MNSKILVILLLLPFSGTSYGQWAVSDAEAIKQLEYINSVRGLSSPGNVELQEDLKNTQAAFHQLSLSAEEKEKYILTEASCGVKKINAKYFDACLGRRNLALNSMLQYDVHLEKMGKHLEAIQKLLTDSRSVETESGRLQRYQTEIQARQALMLGEAARMQGLMQAYKQRDELYALQMVEARETSLSKPPVNDETGAAKTAAKAPVFRIVNVNRPFQQ